MLHTLYGHAAAMRRAWYERPGARRRLERPVVSVGNLSVGGTGKTPLVAAIATWLVARGERPAILSRGYARRVASAAPTIVSDGTRILADAAAAGDEPLMLARAVPGAVVVVAADRHAAGVVAERTLGATVHVLDDGFQHLALARDLDIVVTAPGAIAADAVLPKGRLREPATALARASLLVVVGGTDAQAEAEARAWAVPRGIGATRRLGAPVVVWGAPPPPAPRVVAMAGIGQPRQFLDGLAAAGCDVADAVLFRDHHWYSAADIAAVRRAVETAGAWGVATTAKDAVRLDGLDVAAPPSLAAWPLALDVPRWDVLGEAIAAVLGRAR